jgi:hypothetical protein
MTSQPSKTCTRCNDTKSLALFPFNNKMRDGRNSQCRRCNNELTRIAYYRRRGEDAPALCNRTPRPKGRVERDDAGVLVARECMDCGTMTPTALMAKNKGTRDGVSSYCRACLSKRSEASRQKLHGGSREYHLRRRYGITGITGIQFDEMFAVQDGQCAICREGKAEHVDHDHLTGAVRALLCFTCNVALGNVKDRLDILESAADYLHEWARRQAPVANSWRHVRKGVFRLIAA